jgi:hypothetical protein
MLQRHVNSWSGCGVCGLWGCGFVGLSVCGVVGFVAVRRCVRQDTVSCWIHRNTYLMCVCVCVCTSNQVCQRVVTDRAFKMVGIKGRARSHIPSHGINKPRHKQRFGGTSILTNDNVGIIYRVMFCDWFVSE